MNHQPEEHESLVKKSNDPLIQTLNQIVVQIVKLLALMMVGVIIWGVADVFAVFFNIIFSHSVSDIFDVGNYLSIIGSFLLILVAIEIFMNIIFYLKEDAIHVPLVLATALTAVARKVIILDYAVETPYHIFATAAVILAVGIPYWLITHKNYHH